MGIDYYVYLGPYIEVKTKGLKRKKDYKYTCCINDVCKSYKKAIQSEYCPSCGVQIEEIQEEVDGTYDALEMAEDYGIDNQVYPECYEVENGDTQIWTPNLDDNRRRSWDVKHEEVWEDLSDLNIKEEMLKVEKECAEALAVLEKVYGTKPVIKWGLISSTG